MTDMIHELSQEEPFHKIIKWLLITGIAIAFGGFFGYIFYQIVFVPNNWIIEKMREQFAVTVSLPFAGLGSLFIVLLLQFSSGPIEVEGVGIKFRGASGPIVLWVLCFLSIIIGIRLLWN